MVDGNPGGRGGEGVSVGGSHKGWYSVVPPVSSAMSFV